MAKMLKILLLGGSSEGAELNTILASCDQTDVITSLAGATKSPNKMAGEVITGGFGGVNGLSNFIKSHDISMIIDATHPFADKISQNSHKAAQKNDIPLLRLVRPIWKPESGDRWIYAANMARSAESLEGWHNPFLSIGRKDLNAFSQLSDKQFLVRTIDMVDFSPSHSTVHLIQGRGPFELADEIQLMKTHKIDVLVSKNSGGNETYAKIEAARELQIPVVIIERPSEPSDHKYETVNDLLSAMDAWL